MARFGQAPFAQRPFGILGAVNGVSCSEVAVVTGSLAKRGNQVLAETASVTDSVAKSAARALVLESATIGDALAKQSRKLYAEVLAITETLDLGRLYWRVLSESIAWTEVIAVSWKRLLQFVLSGKP